MDDTPKQFLEEFRSSILKKRIGQIALAVVLAEEVWRLVNAFVWFLIMPILASLFQQSDSVLFSKSAKAPIGWENLFGSILEFLFTVIVVFYMNRWIMKKPEALAPEEPGYSLVGEPQGPIETQATPQN